jgi:hypothetical protein
VTRWFYQIEQKDIVGCIAFVFKRRRRDGGDVRACVEGGLGG